MTATEDLRAYVDHASRLKDEDFLGYVAFSNVSDLDIPHKTLTDALSTHKLEMFGPKNSPTDGDVFRRVFTNGDHRTERQTVEDATGNKVAVVQKLLIRTIRNSGERIVKRVVVETIDEINEDLMYSGTWEIVFVGGDVVTTELEPSPVAAVMIDNLVAKFKTTRGCQDGNAIRNTIHRVFVECKALSMTNGGVSLYFVPKEHLDLYHQLETAMAEISKLAHGGIRVHGFPLIDDQRQRDLIATVAKEDIEATADSMSQEIAGVLREGKVGPKRFASLFESVTALEAKSALYKEALSNAKLSTTSRLSVVKAQMDELRQLMDTGAEAKDTEKAAKQAEKKAQLDAERAVKRAAKQKKGETSGEQMVPLVAQEH